MADSDSSYRCPYCRYAGKTSADVAKHILSTYDSSHMLRRNWAITFLKGIGYTDKQINSYSLAVNSPHRFKTSK